MYVQGFAAALPVGLPMQSTALLALHERTALDTFHSGHSLNPSLNPSLEPSLDEAMECDEGRLSPSDGAGKPQNI